MDVEKKPEAPEKPDAQTQARYNRQWWRSLALGALSGWVIIFLPYLLIEAWQNGGFNGFFSGRAQWLYNGSILLLMPVVQGFVAALLLGRVKRTWSSGGATVILIWLVDCAAAIIFMHEGAICLVMAFPLLWTMIGVAYVFGRYVARWRKGTTASVSLIPLALLVTVGETLGPKPDAPQVVTDEVTVNAPPEYIWRYIVDYPDNPNPPKYWLWSLGLPSPTHSVAPVQKVGARRDCKFTGNQAFEERIAVLEPNKRLVFDITKQPDHPEIIGHMRVDRGELVLRPNADGTTTIIATSWYRLHVRPAPYFAWWAADVTRHVHFRVMGYMKTLAERDYRSKQAL